MRRFRHGAIAALVISAATAAGVGSHTYASNLHATKQILAIVSQGSYVFSPVKTTVARGTKVVWLNKGPAPHTVTSRTRSWKYNKNFQQGQKLSFVFTKAGTYHYVCTIHPGMVGTIVVK